MKDIRIYVISHKPYVIPENDLYLPLQVGTGPDIDGWLRDNSGDNISTRNRNYCELTGMYWVQRNEEPEYVGFAHYRRYLKADRAELERLLDEAEVILPRERHYYIESNYSHYANAHHISDLDMAGCIIDELYPEYSGAFKRRMKMTHGHRCNIWVMRKDLADSYLNWLFDILFELEKRIDVAGYDEYNQRVYGFIAERLLDVWLDYNRPLCVEVPMLYTEKVNWFSRGLGMIRRKLKGIVGE